MFTTYFGNQPTFPGSSGSTELSSAYKKMVSSLATTRLAKPPDDILISSGLGTTSIFVEATPCTGKSSNLAIPAKGRAYWLNKNKICFMKLTKQIDIICTSHPDIELDDVVARG